MPNLGYTYIAILIAMLQPNYNFNNVHKVPNYNENVHTHNKLHI